MGSEWRTVRLSDVADTTDYVANGSFESLRNNVTYRRFPDYAVLVRLVDHNAGWDGDHVYVDQASYEFLRKSALRLGDIVIANVGANAGTVFRAPDLATHMTLGPNAILCRPRDELVLRQDFLYYYLISEAGRQSLRSIRSGSAQPKFNKTDLRSLRIPLPPLSEQRAIAETLGSLDNKIELNRRMSQTLESMTLQFVAGLVANRPAVPCASAMMVRTGAPFQGVEFSSPGAGRPLLRIRDLKTFLPDTWTTETRTDETVIRPGDIVVGMDAEFRATLWLGEESVMNQRVCSFCGLHGVGRAFILSALAPELAFQEQAKTGTTVTHLNKADIDTFAVPELSAIEHQQLSARTEPLVDLIVALAAENRTLAIVRDALISRLFSPAGAQGEVAA